MYSTLFGLLVFGALMQDVQQPQSACPGVDQDLCVAIGTNTISFKLPVAENKGGDIGILAVAMGREFKTEFSKLGCSYEVELQLIKDKPGLVQIVLNRGGKEISRAKFMRQPAPEALTSFAKFSAIAHAIRNCL